jgi:hypothetical protein
VRRPPGGAKVGDVRALAKLAVVVERGVVEGGVEAGEAVHGWDREQAPRRLHGNR